MRTKTDMLRRNVSLTIGVRGVSPDGRYIRPHVEF